MINVEAMKLALDALDELNYSSGTIVAARKYESAIAALRQAISEAEQAEQGPLYISQACAERGCACHYSVEVDGEPILVYTAPPQRTWVSLTDDEINDVWCNVWDWTEVARAIEAKLKEKNNPLTKSNTGE